MKLHKFCNNISDFDDIKRLKDVCDLLVQYLDIKRCLILSYRGQNIIKWYSFSTTYVFFKFKQYLQCLLPWSIVPRSFSMAKLWLEHLNFAKAFLWTYIFVQYRYLSGSSSDLKVQYVSNLDKLVIFDDHSYLEISDTRCLNIHKNNSTFPAPWDNHTLPKPNLYSILLIRNNWNQFEHWSNKISPR